jgi:glycosyltransferase involved in cell wall biosynthesis
MPAYNAAETIEKTWREVVAHPEVALVIVVDDAQPGPDAREGADTRSGNGLRAPGEPWVRRQPETCYQLALDQGADIVVMVHPDYQYTPKLIPAMVAMVGSGLYACVIASRISGGQALAAACRCGGTWQSRPDAHRQHAARHQVSEFHTGYRAFSRELLQRLPLAPTRTTSSSTTKCWRRLPGWATRLARFRARPGMRPTRRRSISAEACGTVSDAWRRPPHSVSRRWASFDPGALRANKAVVAAAGRR